MNWTQNFGKQTSKSDLFVCSREVLSNLILSYFTTFSICPSVVPINPPSMFVCVFICACVNCINHSHGLLRHSKTKLIFITWNGLKEILFYKTVFYFFYFYFFIQNCFSCCYYVVKVAKSCEVGLKSIFGQKLVNVIILTLFFINFLENKN